MANLGVGFVEIIYINENRYKPPKAWDTIKKTVTKVA